MVGTEDKAKVEDGYVIEEDDSLFRPAAGTNGGYVWEEEYKRSWEVVQQDNTSSLQSVIDAVQRDIRAKKKKENVGSVQKGIIRHLYIILDLSKSMLLSDVMPSNLDLTLIYLEMFINEYFDQNPISQLGIIVTSNGLARKLTELSGNPAEHIRALKRKESRDCVGEPSLQNALEMARASFAHLPQKGNRELLVIMASLTSCDPKNVHETIENCSKDQIRATVISVAAEVHLYRELALKTYGSLHVPLNERHYKEILRDCIPPITLVSRAPAANACLIMGFPSRVLATGDGYAISICACHGKPTPAGFQCPRCKSKVCELPTECPICNLDLVSSPHLARSYHHVFPVAVFLEVSNDGKAVACYGCQRMLDEAPPDIKHSNVATTTAIVVENYVNSTMKFQCPNCKNIFCHECDLFIHDILHNCPGCISF